jgi:hypothetical protein
MKFRMTAILTSLLFVCTGTAHAKPIKIGFELSEGFRSFEFVVSNPGPIPVEMPELSVGFPKETGYWIFLYDSTHRRLIDPVVTMFPPGPLDLHTFRLEAGGEKGWKIPKSDLLKYFNAPPGCYLLVGKFRMRKGSELIDSNASTPIEVCLQEG